MQSTVLDEQVQEPVRRLRACLRTLAVAAGCDLRRPQDVHRRLGIDRVLCWKISRVDKAQVGEEALRHLPSKEGMGIFLDALARAGAPKRETGRALDALREVTEAVRTHVGDRNTLELVLDGAQRGRDALAVSRKLAFRGNSGIWGVQARVRSHLIFVAPNAERPDHVDTAFVSGWVDFRRLRTDAPWRVFHRRHLTEPGAAAMTPLDADEEPGGAMLLREFCTRLPPLLTCTEGRATVYELGPTAAGAAGATTIYSGFLQRLHGMRRGESDDDEAEFGVGIQAPVEHLAIDLLVHRDLPYLADAHVRLSSAAFNDGSVRTPGTRLPIEAAREELGSPPIVASPHERRHAEIVEMVFRRCGWRAGDFGGARFTVEYPPFPSVAVLGFALERS